MRVSLIQMNTIHDKASNLDQASKLISNACKMEHPDLVVLPECFAYLGTKEGTKDNAEIFPNGDGYNFLCNMAKKYNLLVHGGSIIEKTSTGEFFNTTVVIDQNGNELARYRKIQRFDVDTPDGVSYRESDVISNGNQVVTYNYLNKTIGCTICYDIRFSELYASLSEKKADIITIPAAFTLQTGKDHWEILCRTRAVETQTFVLAAGQHGSHLDGDEKRDCYGNSMIVDPWGHVISRAPNSIGFISAVLDFDYQNKVRQILPVANHHILKSL